MNKKIRVFLVIAVCIAGLMLDSCSSTPKFSAVSGKEWKLVEVQVSGTFSRRIRYDRDKLKTEGIADIFVLNFTSEKLSGVGARNTYSAPFTLGENQSIQVKEMILSENQPLVQPEKLQEKEYFAFVQNISKWSINKEKRLVLNSKTEDGNNVRLMFALK